MLANRVAEEREQNKKHIPAKALRENPNAKVVDISEMNEFIDH